MSSTAYAQDDPASLERTIPKFEVKPAEKQPQVTTPSLPPEAGARIAGTFILGAVSIEGATVFSPDDLAGSFEPFLASRIGQAELDKIAADITERYRRAGYLLSYAMVPAQLVQSGIVRIRVVEGYIDKVRIQADGRSAAAIRDIVERLGIERPLRASTLERTVGLVRDTPGIIVGDVRLSRSPADPARHQMTIVIGADRARALAYSDNRGTIDGARLRGYTSFKLGSLAVPGDQLQVDLFAIPSDKFRFLYGLAKASLPLNSDGLRLSAAISRGDQVRRLAGPDQKGRSRQLVAELGYPFVKSRAFSMVGRASLSDWLSEEKRDGVTIQRDRLQVARAWFEFSRVSKMRVDGRIGVSQGLDLGSATEKGDLLASRPGAGAKFTKVNADVQIATPLAERVMLRLDASAQVSTKPLLAPEEFALGGTRIGRAFDFNEMTGDHGIGGMLELSYRLGDSKRGAKSLELLTFLDGGGAFRRRASPGLPDEEWLASAGIGARVSAFGLLWAGEFGAPIVRSHVDRSVRGFVSLTKAF